MNPEECFFPDRRRLFAALSADIQARLGEAIAKRRKASMALAGGSTPGPLYESLCVAPLRWDKVSLTVTDERWVAPEDPASNEYLVRDLLLKRRAAEANFIPFKTNHARPSGAAATTERRVSAIMPFDICLLGMGGDGHVASLIPGAEGFDHAADPHTDKRIAAVHAAGAAGSPDRLTLTAPGILASRRIILLFMGAEKLATFRAAAAGELASPVHALVTQNRVPVQAYWAP
jgi:6-phosphogluconolactonase